MCRVLYMPKKIDETLLKIILKHLEEEAGGDGNGIGGFIEGKASLAKDTINSTSVFAQAMIDENWDTGVLYHTRRASVGEVNNNNCHPFVWDNSITIHNGHVDGSGLMKLMMLENIEKYAADGWTMDRLSHATDSEIMAYFIKKHGFEIVPLLNPGTVLTMYPDRVEVFVGYCLQAINVGGIWIYASTFPAEIGMKAKKWAVFLRGSRATILPDSTCKFIIGECADGKVLWREEQKRMKEQDLLDMEDKS